jgi:hypothetical protein
VHSFLPTVIVDLKDAVESKEDILVILTKLSKKFDHQDEQLHDQAVRNGTARTLLRQLHRRLTEKPPHKTLLQTDLIVLEESRALPMAILLSAIDTVLRCSDKVLQANMTQLQDDLGTCLPRIVETFACWRGETTIKLVTLSCTIRIMRRVGPFMVLNLRTFTKSLLRLLDNTSSAQDIRIDAACAIASYIGNDDSTARQHRATTAAATTTSIHGRGHSVALQIEQESAVVVSILSTAIMTSEAEYLEDTMLSLLHIIQCPYLFPKLRKRRCAVLALCKQLSNNCKSVRKLALELVWAFLSQSQNSVAASVGSIVTTVEPHGVIEKNLDSLVAALQKNVVSEANAKLQIYGIRVLSEAIKYNLIDAARTSGVMKALCRIARNVDGIQVDEVIIDASTCYLAAASLAEGCPEILGNIIGFVKSPFANVRKSALQLIKDISFWNPRALAAQMQPSSLLDTFKLIITSGSDGDCTTVMQICRQLVLSDGVPQLFCSHSAFLSSLVNLVIQEPVTNRSAFINAVEVALALMQIDDQLPCFLEFIDLLPWLVTFANRTSDEEVKEKLIATVIRFASAKLEHI